MSSTPSISGGDGKSCVTTLVETYKILEKTGFRIADENVLGVTAKLFFDQYVKQHLREGEHGRLYTHDDKGVLVLLRWFSNEHWTMSEFARKEKT